MTRETGLITLTVLIFCFVLIFNYDVFDSNISAGRNFAFYRAMRSWGNDTKTVELLELNETTIFNETLTEVASGQRTNVTVKTVRNLTQIPMLKTTRKTLVGSSKIILEYTQFFSWRILDILDRDSEPFCDYECVYTDDKSQLGDASVVIFHSRDLRVPLPSLSNLQTSVYLATESPVHTFNTDKIPSEYFDMLLSYTKNSDVFMPYDEFRRYEERDLNPMNYTMWDQSVVKRIVAKKSELILQFVSNCKTDSGRERYLDKLQKLTNVTVVGKCASATRQCGLTETCEHDLIIRARLRLCWEAVRTEQLNVAVIRLVSGSL
ncbi:hypothetical protein L596_030003 [Steinernema carpocapsae]|uniref:Fucosyltransferase n=1 Tax=Steinernema carpocapsae TaxID=34508 RepID=A0A4U5LRG2_STECR|nr:hypothetical protein L596_030003 [Steinernema carpocapsae]